MIEATELIHCQPASPFCPPNWRWRRAEGIRLGLLRDTPRRRDLWVGRALKFLIDQSAVRGDASCPESARPDPAVLGAFRVWSSGDPRPRMELEARVLARQTSDEISARLALAAVVLEAYEQLFFHVRGRLGKRDFIMATVIRHTLSDGFAAGDADSIMKLYAYGYGPVVLDAVIAALGVGGAVDESAVAAREPKLARSVRAAIAARSIPITGRTAPILVRLNDISIEVERRAAADVAPNAPIRATIEPWPATETARGGGDSPMVPAVGPLYAFEEPVQEPAPAGPAGRTGTTAVSAEAGPGHHGIKRRRTA